MLTLGSQDITHGNLQFTQSMEKAENNALFPIFLQIVCFKWLEYESITLKPHCNLTEKNINKGNHTDNHTEILSSSRTLNPQ